MFGSWRRAVRDLLGSPLLRKPAQRSRQRRSGADLAGCVLVTPAIPTACERRCWNSPFASTVGLQWLTARSVGSTGALAAIRAQVRKWRSRRIRAFLRARARALNWRCAALWRRSPAAGRLGRPKLELPSRRNDAGRGV